VDDHAADRQQLEHVAERRACVEDVLECAAVVDGIELSVQMPWNAGHVEVEDLRAPLEVGHVEALDAVEPQSRVERHLVRSGDPARCQRLGDPGVVGSNGLDAKRAEGSAQAEGARGCS